MVLSMVFGGTGHLRAQDATPTTGGRLAFATNQEPDCFDPQISAADATSALVRTVVDSLVAQTPDGELVPWLAKSWTVNDELTEFTFELETGITFSDGTPFNAEAVKYNFDRIANPETGSQFAISLLGPYGGTQVVDEDTVVVGFTEPFSPFLQAASQANLGILSPTATAASDPCSPIVGSGPYVISEVNPAESVILSRNEAYTSFSPLSLHEGVPYLDEIEFRFIPDDAVRTGSLESGQVDAASGIPPNDVQGLTDAGFTLSTADRPGAPYSIYINSARAPWDDVRTRQALQKSVDVSAIVDALYLGYYQRAWSPLSQPTVSFDESLVDSWNQDIDGANALLDEAGWTWNGDYREKEGQRLTAHFLFISTGREQRELVAQLVQEQAKQVGIDVQIESPGIAEYLERLQNGDYDLGEYSFVRASPDILRSIFSSDNIPSPERVAQNYAHVANPDIDALLGAAMETLDVEAQNDAYAEVQRWTIENAVVIPIYVQAELTVSSEAVSGITFDANGFPIFYDAWIAQ
jgi:peptide/nickel transport system substrate-binding protein